MPALSSLVSEPFAQRLKKATEAALAASPILRVFSHHDADGISAASVMSQVLTRAGIKFQLTILKGLDREFVDELDDNGSYLFMDMGSSHIPALEKKHMVIVLDHHKPSLDSEKVIHVNTHVLGVDGTHECSAATLSFLFGLALDRKNWDLASIAMVGMIGDKQHLGGFKGVNDLIVNAAVEKDIVKKEWGLANGGDTLESSISMSFDPYFKGLSGNPDTTKSFLSDHGLDPTASPSSLKKEEMQRLASALALWMLERDVDPVGVESIAGDKMLDHSTNIRIDVLVGYSNAIGKEKQGGTGVAMLTGSKWAMETASAAFNGYRDLLLKQLGKLELEGAKDGGALQYIESDVPSINGPLAGIGMQFILPQAKPTLCVSVRDDKLKVSSRGTMGLVGRGLDLSKVCHLAAEKCGGEGGGHPIASGATVPFEKKEEFLAIAAEIVADQLS